VPPSRDQYYLGIAIQVATRATCPRRSVGAVIVNADRILSTGFNGAPRGMPHCDQAKCFMIGGSCVRAVHAETNAIAEVGIASLRSFMTPFGTSTVLYTTTSPCPGCLNLAIQASITKIVYCDTYEDPSHGTDERARYVEQMAKAANVMIVKEQI
jgi:dCMP deaminase